MTNGRNLLNKCNSFYSSEPGKSGKNKLHIENRKEILTLNGTILGMIGNSIFYQNNDTEPNRNIIAFGGPGSYKTQAVVLTNVYAETENSIVVTSTKGGVYEKTVALKIKQGYTPYVINFDDMRHSNRYNPFDYITRDIDAATVANKIVESGNKESRKDIWFYSQQALLKSLILYVLHESLPEDRNLPGVTRFLQTFDTNKNKQGLSELDKQFVKLDFNHPARRAYELGFKKAQGEMQGSIIMSLLTTIADYVDEEVGNFVSFSDFDLKDIGKRKIILYIIMPTMKNAFENLSTLFLSQLFEQLYELASENHDRLPLCVDFILDEFTNLGKFPKYEEFLATCREYGIGVTTICQSLTQLQDKYGRDRAESILGNNAVKMCLNASNETTAKYFSDLLGKATVKVETGSESVSKSGTESRSSSDSYSYTSRSLMTPDEIMNMKSDEAVLTFAAKGAMKVKKACQFHLFPGADSMNVANQKEYIGKADESQLLKFNRKTREFMDGVRTQVAQTQSDYESSQEFDISLIDGADEFFN